MACEAAASSADDKSRRLLKLEKQMKWFNSNRKRLEMLQAIRPTSRATLKMQCLFAAKGDIEEAGKLYDYFAKDMPDLPDYDPPQLGWMDHTKDAANGIVSWLGNNREALAQGYEIIRALSGNRLPPLFPPQAESVPPEASPLPEING